MDFLGFYLFILMLQVHLEYLEAGADILVTSSYQVCTFLIVLDLFVINLLVLPPSKKWNTYRRVIKFYLVGKL